MNTVCSATHIAAVACRSHTRLYVRANGERLGNREIDGKGEPGLRVPEQCLIGNRAANNYPCARIRARHMLILIGLSWDTPVQIAPGRPETTVTIKIGVARRNDDRRHVNTTTKRRGENGKRERRALCCYRGSLNDERLK